MPRRKQPEQGGHLDSEWGAWAESYEREYEHLNYPAESTISGFAVREGPRNTSRLQVLGDGFSPKSRLYLDGQRLRTKYLNKNTLEVDVSARRKKSAGAYAQLAVSGGAGTALVPLHAGPLSKPAVTGIQLRPRVPRHGEPFDIKVSYRAPADESVDVIKLGVVYPNGEPKEGYFKVTPKEQKSGTKLFKSLATDVWGPLHINVTVYSSTGAASTRQFRSDVVPANPFQVAVYPQYSALSWKGAVSYNSSNKRYYCHARCVFSNGNDFPVTITPLVLASVTDGGNPVTSFFFNLSSSTVVPANSTRTLYLYTYYKNSDTADIFRNFGDVRIQLTFITSAGAVADSAVWVMMGQVKVACNFVGNFSGTERSTVRNIVLGAASAIYEQVDLSITSAPILEIPSSNSDWSRFRVIRIDSCKNGISSDEADDMKSDWSSPGSYSKHIDMWFVESFSGASCASSTGGFSPRPGPASKSGDDSGVVIDIKDLDPVNSNWGRNTLSVVVAHELGHYLGLKHHSNSGNFMAASTGGSNTAITWSQHNKMEDHDWVQKRNP